MEQYPISGAVNGHQPQFLTGYCSIARRLPRCSQHILSICLGCFQVIRLELARKYGYEPVLKAMTLRFLRRGVRL